MTGILVVADASWVRNEVHAALTEPDTTLIDLADPTKAAAAVLEGGVDLVIVDMQVGSMGGMAVTRSVREQLSIKGHPPVPVVMLLDRAADGFLAKRAGAAAWVAKPFTSHQLLGAYRTAMGAMGASPLVEESTPAVSADATGQPVTATEVAADTP